MSWLAGGSNLPYAERVKPFNFGQALSQDKTRSPQRLGVEAVRVACACRPISPASPTLADAREAGGSRGAIGVRARIPEPLPWRECIARACERQPTRTYLNATKVGLQDAMRRLHAARGESEMGTETQQSSAPHAKPGNRQLNGTSRPNAGVSP